MILYSTNCPKCILLKRELDKKEIPYTECTDIEIMISKNIMYSPALDTEDGKNIMNFQESIQYIQGGLQ